MDRIDGGFTGINTALELAERGNSDVVVFEANYLGVGGSGPKWRLLRWFVCGAMLMALAVTGAVIFSLRLQRAANKDAPHPRKWMATR